MSVGLDVMSLDTQYITTSEPIEINIKSLIKHSTLDERLSMFTTL
jgi:hypothetical protein